MKILMKLIMNKAQPIKQKRITANKQMKKERKNKKKQVIGNPRMIQT